MTNFLSDPFENATVSSVDVVNSEDGAYRFGNENLASFNFDGAVPTVLDDAFEAQYLEPGMYFVVPGTDDTLRSVVEVSLDEDDPLDEMTIVYVGENSLLSTYTCDGSDFLTVQYESWDERVLGTQGWTITAGGNAIFSNVSVRGEVSAESGDIGGWIIQNQDTDTHGAIYYDASIDIGESGAGVYITGINTGYGTHYDTWIPEDDDEEDPFHLPSQFYIVYAPGSDPNVAGAKRPRWNSASTTFYVDGHGRFSLGNALTFDSNSGSLVIGGYASSSDLDGYIPDGDAAQDIVTNATTITGGNISTGRINSSGYNGPATGGGSFSTVGSQFNLDDGTIVAPNFRIDNLGNAYFRGNIDGSSITGSTITAGPGTEGQDDTITIKDFGAIGSGIQIVDASGNAIRIINRTDELRFVGSDNITRKPIRVDDISCRNISAFGSPARTISINQANFQNLTGVTDPITGAVPVVSGFTNIVYTNSSYSDPSWITSLAGSKISGNITGNAANITSYNINQNLGTGNSPTFAGLTSNGATFVPDAFTATVSNRVVNVNAAGRLGNPSSSHTIKKNIIPLTEPDSVFSNIVPVDKLSTKTSDDSYKNILSLTPVKFEWDIEDQTPGPEFGFIAEEIIEKMPESSLPGHDGKPPYYKTTSLLASMLAVLQDQQKMIEDLQDRVLQLESQLG